MEPSREAIEAAESAYRKVWSKGKISDALGINSLEVALRAAYAIDFAALRSGLEASQANLRAEYKSVSKLEQQAEALRSELQAVRDERIALSERCQMIESELQAAREQIDNLNDAHDSLNRTCNGLRKQLQAAQARIKEMEELFDPNHFLFPEKSDQ